MKARLAAVMLAVLLAAGCVGTGGGQPTATMGLYLADTRTGGAGVRHDVSEIWITITEIQGERDGRWGWWLRSRPVQDELTFST